MREETPSLAKMLLTWRSTVRSLSTSSAAIALLVLAGCEVAQHLELPLGEAVGLAAARR